MKDLSNDIIKSIEKGAVKPVPHWQYVAKKLLFLAVTVFLVLLGALAMSLGMYIIQSIDWNVYQLLGYGNVWSFFLNAFPYIFIFLLIISLILAYYLYRQTPKGHKINLSMLVIVLIVVGLSLAFMLHILGVNREAYFQLARMPFYHQMMFTKEGEWSQPGKGLLWGEVLGMNNGKFSLRDNGGKSWNVLYDNNTSFDRNISEAVGQDVKIIGKQSGDNEFQAKQVQGWDGVIKCSGHRNMMRGVNGGGGMMNWRY